MRIHLIYADGPQDTKSLANEVSGIQIIKMEIVETEEDFAKAKLLILAGNVSMKEFETKKLVIISKVGDKIEQLFVGFPVLIANHEETNLMSLELVARPAEYAKSIREIAQISNPLFPETHSSNSVGFVEKSFFCDRVTHKIQLSPWYGVCDLEISGDQFIDGFKTALDGAPISSVEVMLSTQWLQHITGFFDMGRHLRQKLSNAEMIYDAPISLKKSWPRQGKRMGKTGYWVVKSDFKSIPVKTNSDKTEFGQVGSRLAPSKSFQKYKHSFELVLGWLYKQKRTEDVSFTIKNGISEVFPNYDNSKTLKIRLKNPFPIMEGHPWLPGTIYNEGSKAWHEGALYQCKRRHCSDVEFSFNIDDWQEIHKSLNNNSDSAKFFDTKLGEDAIAYGIRMACWHLAKSTRVFKTSFELPFEMAEKLSVDKIIRLKDSRLPGGEITGKVVSLGLFVDADKNLAYGHVEMLSSIGNGNKNNQLESVILSKLKNFGGIEGVGSKPSQILSRIDVKGGEKDLPEVKIELLDLRTTDKTTRSITITDELIWSSPKQI